MTVRRNQPACNPREGVLQNLKKERKCVYMALRLYTEITSYGSIDVGQKSSRICLIKCHRVVSKCVAELSPNMCCRIVLFILSDFK